MYTNEKNIKAQIAKIKKNEPRSNLLVLIKRKKIRPCILIAQV